MPGFCCCPQTPWRPGSSSGLRRDSSGIDYPDAVFSASRYWLPSGERSSRPSSMRARRKVTGSSVIVASSWVISRSVHVGPSCMQSMTMSKSMSRSACFRGQRSTRPPERQLLSLGISLTRSSNKAVSMDRILAGAASGQTGCAVPPMGLEPPHPRPRHTALRITFITKISVTNINFGKSIVFDIM